MSDKVLLRHFSLHNGQFIDQVTDHFTDVECKDVFAFREFGTEDSEELKQEVGIECDRAKYETYVHSNVNFKALVYQINPTRILRYFFTTRDILGCTYDVSTRMYYDPRNNYFSYTYFDELITVDELTAVQQQFSSTAATYLCHTQGLLHNFFKPEKILLQHYRPDHHYFTSFNCTGTYAFRELQHGANRGMLRRGVYCDRDKYLALMHGDTHFHAITYYRSVTVDRSIVYNKVDYVFATLKDMNCSVPSFTYSGGYSDLRYKYINNKQRLRDFIDEDHALTNQFGVFDARAICQNNGLLPFQFPWLASQQNVTMPTMLFEDCCPCLFGNATLLMNKTNVMVHTVPVSEMEVLSSVASLLLMSPVMLIPIMLTISNLSEIFFDSLASLFTFLSKKR